MHFHAKKRSLMDFQVQVHPHQNSNNCGFNFFFLTNRAEKRKKPFYKHPVLLFALS